LGLGAQTCAQIGGRRICGCIGQRLLAIVGSFDLGVLKPWAGRGIWPVAGPGARGGTRPRARPARNGRLGGRLGDTRHLQSPVPRSRLAADGDLVFDGRKSEHLDLYIPHAGRQIQCVTAGIVGVCHQLRAPLAGGDGGSGNPLIGGPYRTGELSRGQEARSQQHREIQGWDRQGSHR